MSEAEHPELVPLYWIAKWVDFQDKYGFGYALSQGHKGINFNDGERVVLNANDENIMFIDTKCTEYHYSKSRRDWPETRVIQKKMQLTTHICKYMEKLIDAGNAERQPCDDFARIPYLKKWCRIDDDLNIGGGSRVRTVNSRVAGVKSSMI